MMMMMNDPTTPISGKLFTAKNMMPIVEHFIYEIMRVGTRLFYAIFNTTDIDTHSDPHSRPHPVGHAINTPKADIVVEQFVVFICIGFIGIQCARVIFLAAVVYLILCAILQYKQYCCKFHILHPKNE
jgi:hypothetical protein